MNCILMNVWVNPVDTDWSAFSYYRSKGLANPITFLPIDSSLSPLGNVRRAVSVQTLCVEEPSFSSHALCPPCTYTQIRITCQILGTHLWDLESSFTYPLPQQRDLLYYSIYVLHGCASSDMNAFPL